MHSFRSLARSAALAAALTVVSGVALAADPTIDQIYQAARSGQVDKAQEMMRQVLRDHPSSAKAHYVEADLLAQQGQYAKARDELTLADQLEPGLPFVKPEEVTRLRSRLATAPSASSGAAATSPLSSTRQQAPASSGIPVGLILAVAGVAAFIWVVMRFVRNANGRTAGGYGPNQYGSNMPVYPNGGPGNSPGFGPGYGPGVGPGYPQQPGLGRQVAGGLATGLAVGAGVVAAESIADRMFGHHNGNSDQSSAGFIPDSNNQPVFEPSQDFGIQDNASWDDSGSGFDNSSSSSDWDT